MPGFPLIHGSAVSVACSEIPITKAVLDDPSKRPRFFVSEDEVQSLLCESSLSENDTVPCLLLSQAAYLDRLSAKHGADYKV